MSWRILKYIQHLFSLRRRKGHGIHSPYLFEFVNEVVFNGLKVKVPGKILVLHRELKGDRSMISAGEHGASSSVNSSAEQLVNSSLERSVGSFVRRSSVSEKYAALLYRISRWFEPDVILELGTGLGISTLYLGAGSPDTPLKTIEGDAGRAKFSGSVIKLSGLESVQQYIGDLEQELDRILKVVNPLHPDEMDEKLDDLIPLMGKRLLAFVDGNHHYEPTIAYLRKLVDAAGEEAVIVMDDIYWSKGMYAAWMEVISWPEVRVSIDLYHMGILLLRSNLNKAEVKINF